MKNEPSSSFRLLLAAGDCLAIGASFLFAYLARTSLDPRPYYFEAHPWSFLATIVVLIPLWLIILALLGLYNPRIFLGRSRLPELTRLAAASLVGIMAIVSYDFFTLSDLFPVRTVAIYAFALCFFSLFLIRTFLRFGRRQLLRRTGRGLLRTIIIGSHQNTTRLCEHRTALPEDGFRIVGLVAGSSFIPPQLKDLKFSSLKDALDHLAADVIIQTDEDQTEYIYKQSIEHQLLYYFVPSESALSSHIGELQLVGSIPALLVRVTPLAGSGRLVQRTFDILLSSRALLVAALPMTLIWLAEKLTDPRSPALYSELRLSRGNKKVRIYKFRSIKPEYNGLSPEAAFEKMGRPDLVATYRGNGDYLDRDPRSTRLGHFLRATSLDELPQLWNVLKGDIALVGPRALVPGELRDYGDRSLLLSVKSGLTGLAQVSGRRDLSFAERRSLDLYYIQNWSLRLDFQIILRTFSAVLFRKGAR